MACEDYPACGHTDGLPCDWVSPADNPTLYYCDAHEVGGWHEVGTPCPRLRYELWDEDEDEDEDEDYYPAEDAGLESSLFGDC